MKRIVGVGSTNRTKFKAVQTVVPTEDIIDDLLFLCNWGALVSAEGKTVYASGARIQLPQSFQQSLLARNELSSLMNAYQNRTDIRSQEGAVGIFSNGEVDRSQLFIHV